MKKLFSTASCILFGAALYAQTCVGTFHFTLHDSTTKKPIREAVQKSIIYAFTTDESEYYDNVEPVEPIDSVVKKRKQYSLRINEKGYSFFKNDDPAGVDFATLCGMYLIHMEFYGKNDTMTLSIYNIPAHQYFRIDTMVFRSGNYFIDLQASNRLSEFTFLDDKGYFVIPYSAIEPYPAKEEKD